MDAQEYKMKVIPLNGKLYRFALSILKNNHDAEDVVQEIFLKLWNMRNELETINNLAAFAYKMTRNLCLDRLKMKHPQYIEDQPGLADGLEKEDHLSNPEKKMTIKETVDKVKLVMKKLPELQRTIMQLRDIEELTYEEIAGIMGMEINTVRVNVSRARKSVRESLIKNYQQWNI